MLTKVQSNNNLKLMSLKNCNKKSLNNKIYHNLGFSKSFTSEIIDDLIESLVFELVNLRKVKISSFGTFSVINKKERLGRNPKNKVVAKISARKVVKFKPSLMTKNKINGK